MNTTDGPCTKGPGPVGDGESSAETPPPARVTFSADGRSIRVSDADPSDDALVRNARDAWTLSGEMLSGGLTEPEFRFLAKTLRQSLGDVLDLFAPEAEVSTLATEVGQ